MERNVLDEIMIYAHKKFFSPRMIGALCGGLLTLRGGNSMIIYHHYWHFHLTALWAVKFETSGSIEERT